MLSMFPEALVSKYVKRRVLCRPTAIPNSAPSAYFGVPCNSTRDRSVNVDSLPLSNVGFCVGRQALMPAHHPVSPCWRTSGSLGGGGGGCWMAGREADPGGA